MHSWSESERFLLLHETLQFGKLEDPENMTILLQTYKLTPKLTFLVPNLFFHFALFFAYRQNPGR